MHVVGDRVAGDGARIDADRISPLGVHPALDAGRHFGRDGEPEIAVALRAGAGRRGLQPRIHHALPERGQADRLREVAERQVTRFGLDHHRRIRRDFRAPRRERLAVLAHL
jgi:hypothetical protein